tara:strand:+ start:9660 stop:10217 length:558 start_codon:yes stop_codon:yes gene_type:complete
MSALLGPWAIKAGFVASLAHGATGQRRKFTGVPYITHPVAVAKLVAEYGGDQILVAAAYLHDVIEDTQLTAHLLRKHFPASVVTLVEQVTNVSTKKDGDRAARKAIDRAHLAKANAQAQTLKLADIIDNLSTVADHDMDFAKLYFAEKALALEVLTKGDPALWLRAANMIRDFQTRTEVEKTQNA